MANKTEPNVTDEKLNEIKKEFFEKYKAKVENNEYHEKDLERLRKDNLWVRAFFKHGLEDTHKTASVINESLTWRKQFGANDLLASDKYPFDEKLLLKGQLFFRNKDKNGYPILFLRLKYYKKDQASAEQIQKFVAYFLEKAYTFSLNNPIVFCFDMTDAGYGNTDVEMTKFVVNCCKTYYAGLVDYVLTYDMPFVFQAIWKIIKGLLPAQAVGLVKFVDKNSIKQYVDDSNLPVNMGGADKYVYDTGSPDLGFPQLAV